MSIIVLLIACVLAASGALVAERWRLRRRWLSTISRSFGAAALVAIVIVLTQASVNRLLDAIPAPATTEILVPDLLVAVVVGPTLHGVAWLLLLFAWDSLRHLALSGRRSPRL